jgi:hypothetical protein
VLLLLTHRKLPQSKAIAIDNDLPGTLCNFGLKVGMVGTVKFEGRIRELFENLPDLAVLISLSNLPELVAMHRSACGPEPTCPDVRHESVIGG